MGRPTHFVAVKLAQHQTVQDAINQVQEVLANADPVWGSTLVNSLKAHFTIQTLCIRDEAIGVPALVEALQRAAQALRSFEVQLQGLKTMSDDKVLYMNAAPQSARPLYRTAEAVEAALKPLGFKPDMRFKPHVTIAKGGQLSKEDRRTMRPFDVRELGELAMVQVPPVLVDRLLMCRMKSTAEDGFYEVVAEFPMSAGEV